MITLRFKYATITLTEEAEQARGRRIDFSKFGEFLGGEGEGWEYVILGSINITDSPAKNLKRRKLRIQNAVFDDNERLEFPLDLIAPSYGKSFGVYWRDGEFERSNYDHKVVAEWNDVYDYDGPTIVRAAEDLYCTDLVIGKNTEGTKFFAVGFSTTIL